MNISFPAKSVYDMNTYSVAFPVNVDGTDRRCLVTEEALQDHFGASSNKPAHLREVFEANRSQIERVAEERIRAGATGEVLLRSADF